MEVILYVQLVILIVQATILYYLMTIVKLIDNKFKTKLELLIAIIPFGSWIVCAIEKVRKLENS